MKQTNHTQRCNCLTQHYNIYKLTACTLVPDYVIVEIWKLWYSNGDHCLGHGHVISKNNVEVLAREEGWFKRNVSEAIEIKTI